MVIKVIYLFIGVVKIVIVNNGGIFSFCGFCVGGLYIIEIDFDEYVD